MSLPDYVPPGDNRTGPARAAPRVGTILWGALVLAAAVLLILVSPTGLTTSPGQLLTGALLVTGAALITAGLLAASRRT
jgi:hypothetical protein